MSTEAVGPVGGGAVLEFEDAAAGGALAFVSGDVVTEYWRASTPDLLEFRAIGGVKTNPCTPGFGCGPSVGCITRGAKCLQTAGHGCKKSQGCMTRGYGCKK